MITSFVWTFIRYAHNCHCCRLLVSGHLQKEQEFFQHFIEGHQTVKEFCNHVGGVYECLVFGFDCPCYSTCSTIPSCVELTDGFKVMWRSHKAIGWGSLGWSSDTWSSSGFMRLELGLKHWHPPQICSPRIPPTRRSKKRSTHFSLRTPSGHSM